MKNTSLNDVKNFYKKTNIYLMFPQKKKSMKTELTLLKWTRLYFCVILLLFNSCKKYPENSLWFKNPEKLHPFNGYITKYNVNSVDSLDLLNNFFNNKVGLEKDIKKSQFHSYSEKGRLYTDFIYPNGFQSIPISYSFSNKKKYMFVQMMNDTTIFKKNLFINESLEWEIIRLARKGSFKLKTTLANGNSYEIQIN